MRERYQQIFGNIDWLTVLTYVILVLMGWFNILRMLYMTNNIKVFLIFLKIRQTDDMDHYGICNCLHHTLLLMPIFIPYLRTDFMYSLLLNIAVPFLGREIKVVNHGFRIGDFGIQPAEFMKFATNLSSRQVLV